MEGVKDANVNNHNISHEEKNKKNNKRKEFSLTRHDFVGLHP